MPETDDLRAGLEALELLLREHAPDIAAALRPGLTTREVRSLLQTLPYPTPHSIETLYRWHDGTELVSGPYRAEVFHNAAMLPLQEAVDTWLRGVEANQQNGVVLWNPSWLPLFNGYKWTYWVLECGQPDGRVLSFEWVDLPDTWAEYGSLDKLIETQVRCWADGAYSQGTHGGVEIDPRKVAVINRALDEEPVDIDHLVDSLDSNDDDAYSNALGQMRTRLYPEAVPALIKLLSDHSRRGRISAAELLGLIGDPAATDALRRAAEADPDDNIRAYARIALDKLDRVE